MGFNPKNLAAFFVFVCILCGMAGWAMHLNIGQLGYQWDTKRGDSPGYGWGHISARPESKE